MMVNTIWYRFEQCQCPDIRGVMQTIPAGSCVGEEPFAVKVIVGIRTLHLDKNAFEKLKADGTVRKV